MKEKRRTILNLYMTSYLRLTCEQVRPMVMRWKSIIHRDEWFTPAVFLIASQTFPPFSPRFVIPQLHIGIKDGMAAIYNPPSNIWPRGYATSFPRTPVIFFLPRTRRCYFQPEYHSYDYPPPPTSTYDDETSMATNQNYALYIPQGTPPARAMS